MLVLPSLVVLARTDWYGAFRIAVALAGLVLSIAWMLERATLTRTDPFAPGTDWLVAHPFVAAAAVAVLAALARAVSGRTSDPGPPDPRRPPG